MRPRTIAAALALVFLATTLGGTPQDAQGYVPGTYTPAAGTAPAVVVDVSHTPTNPDPKQGQTYDYKATFTLSNMAEPNTTNQVVLTVSADPNAPWTSVPVASDFQPSGTFGTPTLSNCSTTSCTATYTNIKVNGTITFTKQATVSATLGTGVLIMGSANAQINTAPTVKLLNVSAQAFPGQCAGTYTFQQQVSGSGAWLVDIKFADVAGDGKVILTQDGSTQIRAWNDPLAEGDTIKIISGDTGLDITAAVLANSTYRSTDPSSPYYIGLDPTNQTKFANADWLDSLNWPYDPDTWTGTTWLPAGTTIEVKREVTYLGCLPGGITGDGTTNREFGIQTEIARANTTVSGSDFDIFSTPGTMAPASCVDRLIVSSNSGVSPWTSQTTVHFWKPGTAASLQYTGSFFVDAIAASALYDTKVFAIRFDPISSTQKLIMINTDVTPRTMTEFSTTGTSSTGNYTAMAFDQNGNLWAATSGGVTYFLTAAQIKGLIDGTITTVAWKTGPTLRHTGTTSLGGLADLAFDGNGNLYVAYVSSNSPFIAKYTNFAANVTASPMPATVNPSQTATGIANLRGLAFVGGTLYAATGVSPATTKLYTIDWKNTLAITQVTAPPTGWPVTGGANVGPSDFASCSYPKPTDPAPGPAYKVQKQIVNQDGTIAPAGTTGTARTINPDGSVTIDYLITVTAVGTTSGSFPTITDNASVPPGFAITGMTLTPLATGVAQVIASPYTPFTIAGAALDPLGTDAPISRTYRVTMTAKATNLNTVSWSSAGTCSTSGAGNSSAGGFFNSVTMTGDTDTADNNDSCAQVFSGKLSLIKQIVDQNGVLLTSTDSKFFDLTAGGPSGLQGVSATSGAIGPTGFVIPGTYRLGEQPNDGGTTSGLYDVYVNPAQPTVTWSCVDVKTTPATVVPVTNGTITVGINQDIQCTIKNTKRPKVYVVKNATTPIAGNTHIGQTITPAADGTFTTSYTITVTNISGFTTTTGPITDGFLVPKGLLWDGTKTATVSYNAGTTGATATGLATSVTQAQLATWATLATALNNLPNNGSVTFTITIPLKLDLTVPSGSTQTVYETNASALSSCAALSSTTGGTYTSFASGIPNMTAIANENQTYSTIANEDNTACVPVVAKLQWAVSKAAASTTAADGTVSAWAPAGTTGGTVQVAADGTVTVNYKVVVTNTGDITLKHPAITDTLTLPTGFGLTSVTVKQGTTTVYSGTTASFTIPASTTTVAPGGTVEYVVQIKASVTSPSTVDWVKAGRCNTDGAGDSGFGGFFNFVSLTGDSDGSANNDACVPVTPASATITVYKLGANCDVNVATCPLPGASFALYAVDPTTAGATPTGLTPDTSDAVFTSAPLSYGVTYWLVETKAPTGFSLLARPVQFSVSTTGITLADPTANAGVVAVATDNAFALTVLDTPAADLPKAGGLGFVPYLVFGMFLVAFGAAYHSKTSGRLAMGYARGGRAGAGRHRAGGRGVRQHHHTNP